MVAAVRVLEEVAARLADRRRRGPAGLLVGLRDGSNTLVVGALHCEPEDFATTQGARVGALQGLGRGETSRTV